jgi:hypothetical protein
MANTITQSMKIPILIRSQTPIIGVGKLVAMFGASLAVKNPNTM